MPPQFRPSNVARANIESYFPALSNVNWIIKSPYDVDYQCIAWAACRTDRKWWPTDNTTFEVYWPFDDPIVDESVSGFTKAFSLLGYKSCDRRDFEIGYQKVAIYALNNGQVTHMARQHFCGRGWLSKPGELEDILHRDLESIEGDPAATWNGYGKVAQILKRSWLAALFNRCLLRCLWHAFKFFWYRLAQKVGFV